MFDQDVVPVGLWSGESTETFDARRRAEDEFCYELTCQAESEPWAAPDRHVLPDDFDSIPLRFLGVIVSGVDPERLNGHDAVRLMQARARLSAHHEAGKYEAMAEVAFSSPGDADSPVERNLVEVDYVAAEIGVEVLNPWGLADRKVVVYPNPDHTANLGVYSAHPERVAAARAHVETLARHLKTLEGETRTLDQLRADVALDLLAGHCLCGTTNSAAGHTNVTIPAETLLELSDKPGELGGYGPVIAEIARKTTFENVDGTWTFTVTDQGQPVATGTLTPRPTASQKRQVRAQYATCVFPGCRQPAYNCDLDHRKPHAQGGPTHNNNLAPLCRHHHMIRHHTPWQPKRLENGDHQWTSPLGHTYITQRGPPD